MVIKYGVNIDDENIVSDIQRLTNLIFKLLPCREEGGEWKTPLLNLILELAGLTELINVDQQSSLILFSKLEALLALEKDKDFLIFRRLIFECLNILTKIKNLFKGEA